MKIFGLILAGGQGRRLGGVDKALVRLSGAPLLAICQRRLQPQVAALALSANGDPARFKEFSLPVLRDAGDPDQGPLAGLSAGIDWAIANGADALVTAAVDTPFLPMDLVARLSQASENGRRVVIAESSRRQHPTFGLWPLALRATLDRAIAAGERRLGVFAEDQGAVTVVFDVHPCDPFFNINRPEDLAEAERLTIAKRAGGKTERGTG